MRKKKVLRIVILALIIIWMLVIFKLSNQDGEQSSSLSTRVTELFVKGEKVLEVEPYVRKIAHLSEYAVRRKFVFITIFNLSVFRAKKNDICFISWNRICYC